MCKSNLSYHCVLLLEAVLCVSKVKKLEEINVQRVSVFASCQNVHKTKTLAQRHTRTKNPTNQTIIKQKLYLRTGRAVRGEKTGATG